MSSQNRVVVECCVQPLGGQFHAIALDARKADFQLVAIGANGLDLDRLAWRLRRGHDRFRREVEGDAQDIGIFHVEEPLLIQIVGLAAEGATDNLLAK